MTRDETLLAIRNARCVFGGRNGDGICHHGYAPARHFVHPECALAAIEAIDPGPTPIVADPQMLSPLTAGAMPRIDSVMDAHEERTRRATSCAENRKGFTK